MRSWALLLAVACSTPEKVDDQPAAVVVLEESAAIKTGAIGPSGGDEASYVLVDVKNGSGADRMIALEGELLDGGGAKVATLGADQLRVPAGATRTFALVADRAAPAARRARFKVDAAVALGYPPQIELGDRREKAGDLRVATAVAKNIVDRTASVVFACSFHDAAGKVLARPVTIAELAPGATQPLRFEGPRDSAHAEIFVGQVAFKP
jgi:hypothetical protein